MLHRDVARVHVVVSTLEVDETPEFGDGTGMILDANPGDVSLHYGDTVHAAPPPQKRATGDYRISAVTGYVRDGVRPHGGRRHYNDVLLGNEDGQVDHMSVLIDAE